MFQNLQGYNLTDLANFTKKNIADSQSTRRENFKSESVFALGPREHGQIEF